MTFDLDTSTVALRDAARAAAAVLSADALTADAAGVLPPQALARAAALLPTRDQALAWAVVVEELAAASGAIALGAAGAALMPSTSDDGPGWAGLRGATSRDRRAALGAVDLGSLAVAAALVGLGRAVLEAVLPGLRAARAQGAKPEQTEWALADAATALDGARLMTWRAAQAIAAGGDTAVARGMARLLAADAAQQAMTAARRALPAEAFGLGTVLERLARDIDTAALVFGDVPAYESAVADGVLRA